MALDLEFRRLLERKLQKSIDFTFKQNMNFKEIWKCTNEDDFLYGWYMGRSDDFCRNQFFLHYHKAPDEKEAKEIHDILLLSRPDYTIFDEMRNTEDFRLFADLRLSGVGMLGVMHATKSIDAIQRFIGRIELGVIPHIIDTFPLARVEGELMDAAK